MYESKALKLNGKEMNTILRFFIEKNPYVAFQIENAKANQIPRTGDKVQLDDVIEYGLYNYDSYTVTEVSYSYDDTGVLVDVTVRGERLSDEELERLYNNLDEDEEDEDE